MKTTLLAFLFLILAGRLAAQSEQRLADYLKSHPEADADGNGMLTMQEARAHRQKQRQGQTAPDPSRGDNLSSVSSIPGIDIPLEQSPVGEVKLKSPDDVDLSFAWRAPQGDGPFPVIVFFHGGGGQSNLRGLKDSLLTGAVQTRFLQRGYGTVQSTRRPFWKTRESGRPSGFYDAVGDAALIVEAVKALPGVDAKRVSLYGGSGGGILAIVTASKVGVACVIAGEPATIVPLDPKGDEVASAREYHALMVNPHEAYTPERREEVRAWMAAIDCPVLVLQGNPTGLYRTNFEILIPEMKELGKDISSISYPDVTHGFYWGTVKTGVTAEMIDKIIEDSDTFIQSHSGE